MVKSGKLAFSLCSSKNNTLLYWDAIVVSPVVWIINIVDLLLRILLFLSARLTPFCKETIEIYIISVLNSF